MLMRHLMKHTYLLLLNNELFLGCRYRGYLCMWVHWWRMAASHRRRTMLMGEANKQVMQQEVQR